MRLNSASRWKLAIRQSDLLQPARAVVTEGVRSIYRVDCAAEAWIHPEWRVASLRAGTHFCSPKMLPNRCFFLLVILFNALSLSIREWSRVEECATEHARTEVADAGKRFSVPR